MPGPAETEVSTPFTAEALAGPTRGSSAARPRPSGGRSPGAGPRVAGLAALVSAASQRGRAPAQARRPPDRETCVYPGAGGSSAAQLRLTASAHRPTCLDPRTVPCAPRALGDSGHTQTGQRRSCCRISLTATARGLAPALDPPADGLRF